MSCSECLALREAVQSLAAIAARLERVLEIVEDPPLAELGDEDDAEDEGGPECPCLACRTRRSGGA